MAPRTVTEVLSEHMITRRVYEKFRSCLILEPEEYLNAIALFMFLGIVNPVNQITNVSTMRRLLNEATSVLNCLKQHENQRRYLETPLINNLIGNIANINFFNLYDEDLMIRSIVETLDGVGRIVFNDVIYGSFKKWEELVASHMMWAVTPEEAQQFAVLSRPSADVLHDLSEPMIEDDRSMFISILKHLPIARNAIGEYFTQRWGDCIERVQVNRPEFVPEGRDLVHGKIVFRSSTYINLVLDGLNFHKYWINGTELWARKYVPRIN